MREDKDYSEIINLNWPQASARQRMSLEQRAKIFLPFAALTGYDALIQESQKITVCRAVLDAGKKLEINEVLKKIAGSLESKTIPEVYIKYFIQDKASEKGIYEEINSTAEKIDFNEQWIKINGIKIRFEDVYEILEIHGEKK